jgi:outer membrane protein insertion porin family
MNRSSFVTGIAALVIWGVSGLHVAAVGQTGGAPTTLMCLDGAPGRPVLKRRQPKPGGPVTNGTSADQMPLVREDCQPQNAATEISEPDLVRVDFAGLHEFPESDVLRTFREQRVALPRNRMPEFEEINKAGAVLREMLQSRGYMLAQVDGHKDEGGQAVTFVITEGVRVPITDILFAGNRVFSTEELTARMRDCSANIKEGGTGYDREVVEFCRHKLTNFVRSRGYLQASLGEPTNQISQEGVVITIPVKEGVLYHLGEIKIEGADTASREQLRSRLSLAEGDIANGEDLGKWLYEDLKRLYGDRGYIEYTAELTPVFKAATDRSGEGVVDISVTIDEGKRFRLGSIEFLEFGGSNLPEKQLRQLFSMDDGDVYSQRLFEAGIKNLNETGLLEMVDLNLDSDFKTDEEQGLLHIVIKVSAKGDSKYVSK